ncbi:MAG: hypothetical protein ACLR7U_07975 [Ruthenibacterium lactatiformans]
MTLPASGIILAIGMGVDANVIAAERIKEEIRSGKSIDGAIRAGFDRGLAPVIDGNVTVIIVAVMLMGAFGPTDGFFARMLKPIFFAFGPSTAGTIYSFGYTCWWASAELCVRRYLHARDAEGHQAEMHAQPVLYGGVKNEKQYDIVGTAKSSSSFPPC